MNTWIIEWIEFTCLNRANALIYVVRNINNIYTGGVQLALAVKALGECKLEHYGNMSIQYKQYPLCQL